MAIPLTILSILYARMGLKLWRRQMPGNVDATRDLTMQTTRVKVSLARPLIKSCIVSKF